MLKKVFTILLVFIMTLSFISCSSKETNETCTHENIERVESSEIKCHMEDKEIETKYVCKDCGKVLDIQKVYAKDPHGTVVEIKDGEEYCKYCGEKVDFGYIESIKEKREEFSKCQNGYYLEQNDKYIYYIKSIKGKNKKVKDIDIDSFGVCKEGKHEHIYFVVYQSLDSENPFLDAKYSCGDCIYTKSSGVMFEDIDSVAKKEDLASRIEEFDEYFKLTNQIKK